MKKELKIILVANTDLTRELGLMNRLPLRKDECALFDFKTSGRHSFWNKNVSFPISLVFCNEDFIVNDVKFLMANQLSAVGPRENAKYVIEAHFETPSLLGIKKGKKLSFVSKDSDIWCVFADTNEELKKQESNILDKLIDERIDCLRKI